MRCAAEHVELEPVGLVDAERVEPALELCRLGCRHHAHGGRAGIVRLESRLQGRLAGGVACNPDRLPSLREDRIGARLSMFRGAAGDGDRGPCLRQSFGHRTREHSAAADYHRDFAIQRKTSVFRHF